MPDLPTLEAALFQKELDHLTSKLEPLVQGIRDVFGEYGDSNGRIHGDSADLQLVGEWLRSIPDTPQGYYAGYYIQVRNPEMRNLPPLLEKLIREAAIRKHLGGVANPPRPELPEPMTEAPEFDSTYYRPAPEFEARPVSGNIWRGDRVDLRWLRQRLCYRTAEDATAVAKAQLAILNPTKP
jgi:hypothetical protein